MQQLIEKKVFWDLNSSGVDADNPDFLVGQNFFVNAENVRFTRVTKENSIGGTKLLSVPQPSVSFICIGAADDVENNMFCYFLYNIHTNDHKIMAYSGNDNQIYTVLLSSQVTGGLRFNKYFPIHSAVIVNGCLYWCEGINNEPRKINISRGIKLNHPSYNTDVEPYESPLNFSEITVIKPPPTFAPWSAKGDDFSFVNNFIANESFQFAFRFTYDDNETTVTGPYSVASKLNSPSATANYILVQMDGRQKIPSTVRFIDLVARYGNGNDAKIIRTWDKNNPADAVQISNHNNNTNQLAYQFYNDISGEPLPKELVLKPFDSVPIYAQTLCAAKNRLFMGNIIKGYDTPNNTSMSLELQIGDVTGVTSMIRPIFQVRAYVGVPGDDNDYGYGSWVVYLDSTLGVTEGYYLLNGSEKTQIFTQSQFFITIPILDPPVTSTSMANLTYLGPTQTEIGNYIIAAAPPGSQLDAIIILPTSHLLTITGLSSFTFPVFKTRSPYKTGIVFFDYAMRRCGVVTNENCEFDVPTRNYNFTTAVTGVTWNLSNDNARDEIPDWAYFYAPVRTLNQKTRFFISAFDRSAKYATKDQNGQFVFNNVVYSTGVVGIGLNTASLVRAGLGYVYTEGDICVLIDDSNNVYELPVIGQQGNYVVIKPIDIGDLTNRKFVYELYVPYKTTENEPYFEIGQIHAVLNPGTDMRQYSFTSGMFLPDAYALSRNFDNDTYVAEAMCPNDLFYKRWDNDGGKPNFVTKLGQTVKEQSIAFSNTYIPDTAVNGLSTFEALDEAQVPEDCGAIQKLILTSKVQKEGTVMLCICTAEANSIYLGETEITDARGITQFFSASQGVIGTINALKGSFGTQNPESVTSYRGNVYWLDVKNGRYIQYSLNGLFPISNYRMRRFWKSFSDLYMSMTPQQIEALGGRPFVFSIIDPYYNELLVSIPKLSDTPPKGTLPDYPSMIYPFDIWDAQGKTVVYDLQEEPNRWLGSYSFNPEGFISLNSKLYSFKDGQLYEHNQPDNPNEFYGVQYKSRLMFLANQEANRPKVYNAISIETNDGTLRPSLTYFRSENPYEQASDLMDFDYSNLEGVLYATLYRNKIVPTAEGFSTDGLLYGEKIRTNVLKVLLEFTINGKPLEFRFVNLMYAISRGHTT